MYILTKDNLVATAKMLAERLGMDIRYTPLKERNTLVPPAIRWGTSLGSELFGAEDTLYNSGEMISLCGSKVKLSSFLTARGFPVVEFKRGTPDIYPIAVRKVLNGHGGEGLIIAQNEEEWRPHQDYYWTPWYKFEFELGVHVIEGRVVKLFKKLWQDIAENEPEFPIRNTERGYHFSARNVEKYNKLPAFVASFYEKVPVKMARLDIGWDALAHTYRIIEANTAPALTANQQTANVYLDFLEETFRR